MELNEQNEVTVSKGIEGIKLELTDNNGKIVSTTKTDENGNYSFNLENANNYNIQFSYPNVTEEELNSINNQAEFDIVKNKLKYNAQDYMVSSEIPAFSQEVQTTSR